MASTSSTITAYNDTEGAKVPVIDTKSLDLATYQGRCDARKKLFVAACLQGDFKAAASVLAEAGKDSMRQQRYGTGADSGRQRVTLIFEGPVRKRLDETHRWMREARTIPTVPGLAPMQLDDALTDSAHVDESDEARESAEAPRGDNNEHAPPTTASEPAADSTLTSFSCEQGPLGQGGAAAGSSRS